MRPLREGQDVRYPTQYAAEKLYCGDRAKGQCSFSKADERIVIALKWASQNLASSLDANGIGVQL
jgi:hypothetical protein